MYQVSIIRVHENFKLRLIKKVKKDRLYKNK